MGSGRLTGVMHCVAVYLFIFSSGMHEPTSTGVVFCVGKQWSRLHELLFWGQEIRQLGGSTSHSLCVVCISGLSECIFTPPLASDGRLVQLNRAHTFTQCSEGFDAFRPAAGRRRGRADRV